MKIYSIIGRLSYLILLYLQITWGFPINRPSSPQVKNNDLGGKRLISDITSHSLEVKFMNIDTESLASHVKRASDYSGLKIRQTGTDIYMQEVNKGLIHTQIINNTKTRNTSKTYVTTKKTIQSESERNFHDIVQNLKISEKEIDLASAQGLNQKLNEGDDKFKTSKMVVTVASTLVALFSMSLLVAIFQCCCRKKQKQNSSSSIDSKGGKDNKVATTENGVEDVNRKRASQVENNHDVTSNNTDDQPMDESDKTKDEEDKVDIRSKIKAFEVKKDSQVHPSPEPMRRPKKRPESEAFKAFESKGIIMGMGKVPKLQVTKESSEDENKRESTHIAENVAEETQEEIDKIGKVADNPDVVIASDDEDDEFAELTRETEVLKSYRKAAPPKGRNRSSRAFRLQQAEQSKSNIFDIGMGPLSPTLEEKNRNSTANNRLDVPDANDTNSSPTDKTEITSEPTNDNVKEKSPSPPKITEEKPAETSGNIFLQIDPTAKRKSPIGTPPVLRKKTDSDSTGSRDSSGRKDKAKSSPLFLSNEKLMKDLEDKLKRQSSGKKKESDDAEKEKPTDTLQTAL